jgi:anti-anti-sigma factor
MGPEVEPTPATVVFRVTPRSPGELVVAGEVDLSTADRLRETLDGVIPEDDLVLDLSEVTFLDAAGLRVLIERASSLPEGSVLILRFPQRIVRRLLQVASVDQHPSIRVED